MRKNYISCDDDPARVHRILSEELRPFGLFSFVQAFSASFDDLLCQRERKTAGQISEQIQAFDKIRKDLINNLRKAWHSNSSEETIVRGAHLEPFFEKLSEWSMDLSAEDVRGLGPGLKVKSLIAVRWGMLMQLGRRGVGKGGWRLLTELYEWLWWKLRECSMYAEAAPADGTNLEENYLRSQFAKYGDPNKQPVWVSASLHEYFHGGLTVLWPEIFTHSPFQREILNSLLPPHRRATHIALPYELNVFSTPDYRSFAIRCHRENGVDLMRWEEAAEEHDVLQRAGKYTQADELFRKLPLLPPMILFPDRTSFSAPSLFPSEF